MFATQKERDEDTARILITRLGSLQKIEARYVLPKKIEESVQKWTRETEMELYALNSSTMRAYRRGKQDAQNGLSPREGVDPYIAGYSTIRSMKPRGEKP